MTLKPNAAAPETAAPDATGLTARQRKRMRRFDNPWANPKLMWGAGLLLGIIALGLLGRLLWDTDLVFTGAGMPRQAPMGVENMRGQIGTLAHPLGTDVSGKDLLALLIVGAPNTLYVGVLASLIGMSLGHLPRLLGRFRRRADGRRDPRRSDVMITIPPLLILVVVQASYRGHHPDADGNADRGLRVAVAHPSDPRAGPVDARGGLRPDGTAFGGLDGAHHVPRDAAEPRALPLWVVHRECHDLHRHGGWARSARPRAPADSDAGPRDLRCDQFRAR
jgi:hypothetical protein